MINWKMYKELTEANGAPGFECSVKKILKLYLSKYTNEFVEDRLGGIFGVKRGDEKGPKVMVAGHMDEVAFMITEITPDGFLKFQPLGGWSSHVLLAQRVSIMTTNQDIIPGVIGSTPPHLLGEESRKRLVSINEMFIDIGVSSDHEVEEVGIKVGDTAVPFSPFQELIGGKRVVSKAWDNRFGCGISVELLKELRSISHPNIVYSGATVQEEVGVRGAKVAANLIDPDICFAVDSSPAGDTPGAKGLGKLGKGVLIRILDRTVITLPSVRDYLLDTAKTHNIPYQFFVSPGGTDAGSIHTSGIGVPSVAIGVCARYIHSHTSIIDKEDVSALKKFVVALVKGLDVSTYDVILKKYN